jgi:hypothetical protein
MNPIAPVAQLDRALPSEGKGHTFESCRVRQQTKTYRLSYGLEKPSPVPEGVIAPGRRGSHQKHGKQPHAQ